MQTRFVERISSADRRPSAPLIVSVHVPKCAGTSFRHLLAQIYGDRLWLNYGTVFARTQARPGCVPAGTALIHGHFLADTFDDIVPPPTLVTWLRHPVERVVSHYYHFLRSPDMRDDCCRALHERQLSLRAFAELDWMRNQATRYFAGKTLADFAAVGIAEHFTDSLDIMADALGWNQPPTAICDNANPARTTASYPLPQELRNYLAYLNAADLATYAQAEVRLEEQCSLLRRGVA